MATISSGILTFSPVLITAWSVSQESRNVVHTIIGRNDPDITLKPATTRTGTLELLFSSASAANTARGILANGTVFTITDSETWLNGLDFVMSGNISTALEDETRKMWTIQADFTEVIP
jgi:hypothetical protein